MRVVTDRSDSKPRRRSGPKLDAERLDFEMARRAISARQLAARAHVHEISLSYARGGRPVTPQTLMRLAKALLTFPVQPGTDLLLLEPTTRTSTPPAAAAPSTEQRPRRRKGVRVAARTRT
jgi:hypothetical protein